MSVHIRLRRMGKKKQAFYRIVAIDSRRARDGRFLETVGTYNPITTPAKVEVKEDLLTKWFNEGAKPSQTVNSLLSQIGYLEKYEAIRNGKESNIELKTTITERKKKTRKMKKAAEKAAEAAAEAEAAKAAEAEAEAVEAEAPAEEKKEEASE